MQKNAYLNVSNQTGISQFRKDITECGYEIITEGALFNHDKISIAVINLYPLENIISKPNVTIDDVIRNIDTDNLFLIRVAAKKQKDITVIIDPNDYSSVINEIKLNGNVSLELKSYLSYKAFEYTSHYDAIIANYLRKHYKFAEFPEIITLTYIKSQDLRYGENPHQQAVYYKESKTKKGMFSDAVQLHGPELSFNNINDTNIAVSLLKEFEKPTVVAVKHANPCGVGTSDTILDAYVKAYNADHESIFDGVIAINREIDVVTADKIYRTFTGLMIAPSYTSDALKLLKQRQDLKLLILDEISNDSNLNEIDMKKVSGGLLVQKTDDEVFHKHELKCVTDREPTEYEMEQLELAWIVAKHTKCNAIVLAKDNVTTGVGPGQMNRPAALRAAIGHGGDKVKGSVMASDGYFFCDCIPYIEKEGITAIIQPGGSNQDHELINECNKLGISMLFTGMRHFKH